MRIRIRIHTRARAHARTHTRVGNSHCLSWIRVHATPWLRLVCPRRVDGVDHWTASLRNRVCACPAKQSGRRGRQHARGDACNNSLLTPHLREVIRRGSAVIVLDVVDPPVRKLLRVLDLLPLAAVRAVLRAAALVAGGVDPQLELEPVQVSRQWREALTSSGAVGERL